MWWQEHSSNLWSNGFVKWQHGGDMFVLECYCRAAQPVNVSCCCCCCCCELKKRVDLYCREPWTWSKPKPQYLHTGLPSIPLHFPAAVLFNLLPSHHAADEKSSQRQTEERQIDSNLIWTRENCSDKTPVTKQTTRGQKISSTS